jgi:hypothetical protein
MLFSFLKYLQPTNYFQLFTTTGKSIFPIAEELPNSLLAQLKIDTKFSSEIAKNYDLSWQAIQKGYVGDVSTYADFEGVSIKDNYHFIRKYFNSAWVFYVLVIRLLALHNPIKEIRAWFKTRSVSRVSIGNMPILYDDWDGFESSLIKRNPKVSVVIPTLNRYLYLKDVLADLEQQDYKNFEVIVVDQSDPYNGLFYNDFELDIRLIKQDEKALWLARNTAIRHAKGDIIALSEDDVRIQSNWLTEHLKCLDYFNAQVSAGVF